MTIKEMHYDVKFKLNKIDSNQYQNLRVPEIDHVLNLAYLLFVKKIAFPRVMTALGFETNQRNIDSIRVLVKENIPLATSTVDDRGTNFELPSDYMFNVSMYPYISKGGCTSVPARKVFVVQHDDRHESDPFAKTSFEWREVNVSFHGDYVKAYHDSSMSVNSIKMDYVRKLEYIHNAQNFLSGQYTDLRGNVLTGSVDCPLPHHTHPEIVDLGVKLISGVIEKPNGGYYDKKIDFSWT